MMSRIFCILQLLVIFWFSGAQSLPAQEDAFPDKQIAARQVSAQATVSTDGEIAGRWVHFAQGLSEITAAAVSPLLVVSVIGANRYIRTPEAERRNLPFFCSPALWGTGLLLLSLCFLKDVCGMVLPAVLKKPADMLELFENKLSALVASTLFVPVVAWQMMQHFGQAAQSFNVPGDVQIASAFPWGGPHVDLRWLVIFPAVMSFFTVWLTAHIINVLVAICPFGLVDSVLKVFRNAILGLLVVSSAIHPFLGGAVSLLLLLVALLLLGKAFRLAVYGTILAADVLLFWRRTNKGECAVARAFIVKSLDGVPSRTYGQLIRGDSGELRFQYRPWLLFRKRELVLPVGVAVLRRDILLVSLLLRSESGAESRVMEFLPRYRPRVDELAACYQVLEVRDGSVVRGFKALWKWTFEVLGAKSVQTR